MQVQIRLFGAFRNLCKEPLITISLSGDRCSHNELKAALGDFLAPTSSSFDVKGLLAVTAIADENRIMNVDEPILDGMRLAVLPPVNGG